jgi:hypothetical protein
MVLSEAVQRLVRYPTPYKRNREGAASGDIGGQERGRAA